MSEGYYFLAFPCKETEIEKAKRYNLSKEILSLFLKEGKRLFASIFYSETILLPPLTSEELYNLLMPMNLDFLLEAQALNFIKNTGMGRIRRHSKVSVYL